MKRNQFIKQVGLAIGGTLAVGFLPIQKLLAHSSSAIKGTVKSVKGGIAHVVVSDGYSLVLTDSKGNFTLMPHANSRAVFISTPAGYAFDQQQNIARHYRFLNGNKAKKGFDFILDPLTIDDNEHQFLIWADPQVKNESDVEKMMEETVPDVKQFVANAGASTLIHGITVGDIVWDEHQFYSDYNRAVKQMGIPFFQCLGNHDMDYNNGGDDMSDVTFQKTYGPTYYSFNRGKAHYVVMDNVRYLGKDREYDGFFQQHQLDWLAKDLAYVPADTLIILCVHIPVHKGTKNAADLYAVLKERNVHIMSGHTHYHVNVIQGNIYEHNHGTVCGAWWTGPICGDGTPCGYGAYKVIGNQLSWHYKSTGLDSTHQMNLFITEKKNGKKQLVANIWNYDPAWKNELVVDGKSMGAMEQFEGFDPLAYETLLGPQLPKPRGFAEPRKTDHLFKANVPETAQELIVKATDRFGNIFTKTYKA